MEERRLTVKCCNVNAFVCNIIINVHLVLRKHAFPRICAFYSFDLLTEVHTTRRYVPQKLETQARTASLRLAVPVVDRCIFFAAENSGNRKLGDCFVSQSDILRVLIVLYLWCELEPLLRAVLQQGTSIVYVVVPHLWLCMVQQPDLNTVKVRLKPEQNNNLKSFSRMMN